MSGTPRDPESSRDSSSGNSDYRSQGEYGTRMNGGSDPVGNYSEDLVAFQEVLPKRYQILREVGRGGMGQVLLAIDRGPNLDRHRMVAIKRMLGSYLGDLESVKRFYDEIDLARDLRHPNVVKMYHSDETRLGPYIVMEYIEGKDLGVYIQERGPLSEPQAVVWFTKLAEALDEGHRKGLIHRDIKPNNILISQEGEPYLTDFGIARRVSAMDKTGTGLGAGTIEYMSLEQLRNSRSESSQDIYSFGATLFHAVEGRPPFESTNLVDFITRLASESAPRATRVSTKLADRIASCLAKNPVERPSNCQAVLAGMVADPIAVPVVAPPISAENKPSPVRQPAASEQTVASRVETQTRRRFGMKGIAFIGLLGLFLWWLAVSGSWNRDIGRTKSDLATESSPSKEVVAPTVDSSAAMSESKKDVEPANPVPMVPSALPEQITNSLGMEFRLIQPGAFVMGTTLTPKEVNQRYPSYPGSDEKIYEGETSHTVELTRPFYLGVHEVTVGQFRKFVEAEGYKTEAETDGIGGWGNDDEKQVYEQDPKYNWRNTGFTQDDNHPVVNVSWNDTVAYAKWLSRLEGREYRLPTEAEWEYACRAGTSSEFSFGDDASELVSFGNAQDVIPELQSGILDVKRSNDGAVFTHRVASYQPNKFGLYDMHGNVDEWCSDWHSDYPTISVRNPTGPSIGSLRVCRGGSWTDFPPWCRSAKRRAFPPSLSSMSTGFRLAMTFAITVSPLVSESKKAADPVKPEAKETAELPNRLTNSLGMEFRLIQPGMFMMGTPENETDPFSDETQHRVTLTKPYYVGVYEVTQGEWEKLMGSQPSYFQNQNLPVQVINPEKQERFPVENISWIEANVFCETLTSKERRAGRISDDLVYRLPTEDEWWTVAGRDVAKITVNQAWFSANADNRTHEVGLLAPNALGIFDLFGNVEEMTTTLILDEKSGEKTCLVLGGSWFSQPSGFDNLNERRSNYLDSTRNFQGFRVVLGSALGIE